MERSETGAPNIIEWPSVRDVARDLDLSTYYIRYLIKNGRLRAVTTRAGNLVDPVSVVEFVATRRKRAS